MPKSFNKSLLGKDTQKRDSEACSEPVHNARKTVGKVKQSRRAGCIATPPRIKRSGSRGRCAAHRYASVPAPLWEKVAADRLTSPPDPCRETWPPHLTPNSAVANHNMGKAR